MYMYQTKQLWEVPEGGRRRDGGREDETKSSTHVCSSTGGRATRWLADTGIAK